MSGLVLFLVLISADLRDAVSALQRGDFVGAEKVLREEVGARPGEAMAWSLLGVALDGQKRFEEAEGAHRRAVAAGSSDADILSNYGNHLVAKGDEEGAREQYRKAVGVAPGHMNSNLQLARIAIQRKASAEALGYLGHLAEIPAPVCFSLGVAFAEAGDFGDAESYFAKALAGMPDDFNVLVNLGTAAASAEHFERARDVFAAALRQQPRNVDVLYRLAGVEYSTGRVEDAVKWLAQAARIAADRADVQKLLAVATSDLGALDDTLAAWDRYLKLAPADDVARREHGNTLVRMGQVERGSAELRAYLEKHGDDAVALFELGVAEQDVGRLDRAIALKPGFGPALSARGGLYYQQGKAELAVKDLEAAAKVAPDDPATLDPLGQTYAALDRTADAVRVLRRAAELAPNDSKTQLHLARALGDAGLAQESKAAMERFRQLGPAAKGGVPAGLVDYLAMSPEERKADYRARVVKAYGETPEDATAQLHYLRLLLEEGKASEAAPIARKLAGSKQEAEAGRALVEARQWGLAREVLKGSGSIDAAIAELHVLEDAGKIDEAAAVATRGPRTAEFLRHAAAVLARHGRTSEAERILVGEGREVMLLRAAVLGAAGKKAESDAIVAEIRRKWPEWEPGRRPVSEALDGRE
jgi:tetratricopeptide (TPR) repeat protein